MAVMPRSRSPAIADPFPSSLLRGFIPNPLFRGSAGRRNVRSTVLSSPSPSPSPSPPPPPSLSLSRAVLHLDLPWEERERERERAPRRRGISFRSPSRSSPSPFPRGTGPPSSSRFANYARRLASVHATKHPIPGRAFRSWVVSKPWAPR